MKETTAILAGVSGVHFVAAELARRGYIPSITLRNTRAIDMLVSNQRATNILSLQVKANRGKHRSWILNKKDETNYSKKLYYVFVCLRKSNERPDFFIVPSLIVAKTITEGHKKWLKTPGVRGRKHRDNPMRRFSDRDEKYLEKWSSLKL